jgi:hypothetical protein
MSILWILFAGKTHGHTKFCRSNMQYAHVAIYPCVCIQRRKEVSDLVIFINIFFFFKNNKFKNEQFLWHFRRVISQLTSPSNFTLREQRKSDIFTTLKEWSQGSVCFSDFAGFAYWIDGSWVLLPGVTRETKRGKYCMHFNLGSSFLPYISMQLIT